MKKRTAPISVTAINTNVTPSIGAPLLQRSRLLNLPTEIQQNIYSHIFTRWSLAILPKHEEIQPHILHDTTFSPKEVGEYLLSGPPGASLLLVSRLIYHIAYSRYGKNCTGKLILGKIKGKTRRKLPSFLKSHRIFSRFYDKIDTLYVYIALSSRGFDLNFRTLFPNIKFADCVVHEASYGPMVRLDSNIKSFLRGNDAKELSDWTQPVVNHFLCEDRHWLRSVHANQSPWHDTEAVVSVKLLGTLFKRSGVVLGYNYHWDGPRLGLLSLVSRSENELMYWEAGMRRGEYQVVDITKGDQAVPQRFRWVQHCKW